MIWIALLRGINVGGNNILPMAELRVILSGLGYRNVKTYIQSGNCVFEASETDSAKISFEISEAIGARFPFRPHVMTVRADLISKALAGNPFPQAADKPNRLHFFIMTEEPEIVDEPALEALLKPGELFAYKNQVFYLFSPEGIWKSKIGAKVEKMLGVPMTARNLRTMMKLQAMVG